MQMSRLEWLQIYLGVAGSKKIGFGEVLVKIPQLVQAQAGTIRYPHRSACQLAQEAP